MQDGEEADLGAEMPGVGCDFSGSRMRELRLSGSASGV